MKEFPKQLIAISSLFFVTTVGAQNFPSKSMEFKLSEDEVGKIPDKGVSKSATGRLVTSKTGAVVFRSPQVSGDIPVAPAGNNPFYNDVKPLFDTDNRIQEVVGTVPVSLTHSGSITKKAELGSNVANVWNRSRLEFKNENLAKQFSASVAEFESNANALLQSPNGWTGVNPATVELVSTPLKPEAVVKFQESAAVAINSLIDAPAQEFHKEDFSLAADLMIAADPDQLFGDYGPVSVNWSFDRLVQFVNATRSVASINYFGKIYGSGFLIGDGLFLTCGHVLDLVNLDDATATFVRQDGAHESITLKFESTPILKSSDLNVKSKLSNKILRCDFALLKLKDSEKLAAAGIKPLEISQGNLLVSMVAVVGYPNTTRQLTIHDNGAILFPYQLPKREFEATFWLRVHRMLKNASSSAGVDDAAYQEQLRRARTSFRTTYGYKDSDAANTNYFYIGLKDEWKDVPVFGIDSSTTHGDSGGAVFDKNSLRVIGLLRGGAEGSFSSGSWFNHDKVIPISEIIDSINQADPALLSSYNVKIFP